MSKPNVKPVPDGYHTATPYLTVKGGARAIEFYTKAFAAAERFRMPGPGGAVMHAELQVGDSVIMLADESPQCGERAPDSVGSTTASVLLYVNDVDATFRQAIASGAKEMMAPTDMFWGDRMAKVSDPFGHHWAIATHVEDVSPEEMGKRAAAMMGGAQ